MKSLKIILLFFAICLLFTQCKKKKYYPENPPTKDANFAELKGKWKLVKFEVDGNDSLSNVDPPFDCGTYDFVPDLDGGYDFSFHPRLCTTYPSGINLVHGFFDIVIKKNNVVDSYSHILLNVSDPYLAGPFISNSGIVHWKIRKLYGGDFWLKTDYNSKEYNVEFKKTE